MNNFFKIIKDTSNWIKINWQINESYRPYLIKKKKTLEIFDEVNTPLDEKVNKIYQLLKDNGHYQKEVALYDEINKKIQLHNQKVVSLKHVIEKFNFNTILENPEAFSQRDLEAYFVAAKEVAGFKSKSKFYTTLIKAIKDAYQHLDVIKIQSNSKPKIEQIISLAPEIYYDGAKLDAIETQLKPFKKLLKSHGQLYYDFNALDQIKLIVEKHNQMFIQHRINLTVFDNINSKSLDQEQREAILKDEVSLLVVAGAGSGKSTTICGKVKYLIEIDHINPGLKKDRRCLYVCSWDRIKSEMNNLQLLCTSCHQEKSHLQKSTAWFYFKNLPIEEQNKLMEQYKKEGSNLPSWSPQDKGH
jgi:DNA helicase-4